eukprot:Opistho-2@48974
MSFSAKSIGQAEQKKRFTKAASSRFPKNVVDDHVGEMLDAMYALVLKHTNNDTKEAKELTEDAAKMIVKIAALHLTDALSAGESKDLSTLRSKLRSAMLTMASFHEVAYTYDREILLHFIEDAAKIAPEIVAKHLTPKSIERVKHAFGFFARGELLDKLFTDGYKAERTRLCEAINKVIEDNIL